jgi:hypothetical protein
LTIRLFINYLSLLRYKHEFPCNREAVLYRSVTGEWDFERAIRSTYGTRPTLSL